jgi:hypothetical protein
LLYHHYAYRDGQDAHSRSSDREDEKMGEESSRREPIQRYFWRTREKPMEAHLLRSPEWPSGRAERDANES